MHFYNCNRILGIAAVLCAASHYSLGAAIKGSCNPNQIVAAIECLDILSSDLTGVIVDNRLNSWNQICSNTYFHQCKEIIREQFSTCLSDAEVDYIMSNVNAEIDGGVRYLCNDRNWIQDVLSNGGSLCVNNNLVNSKKCGFELGYYPVDTQYSDDYCRQQDSMVACSVDVLERNCPGNDVDIVLRHYFESVIRASRCEPISTFSGVHQVSTTVALLSPVVFLVMHKVLRIF